MDIIRPIRAHKGQNNSQNRVGWVEEPCVLWKLLIKGKFKMTEYYYKVIITDLDKVDGDKPLEKLMNDGWEPYLATHTGKKSHITYLRKPVTIPKQHVSVEEAVEVLDMVLAGTLAEPSVKLYVMEKFVEVAKYGYQPDKTE